MNTKFALFLCALLKSIKKEESPLTDTNLPSVAAHEASKEAAAFLVSQTHLILVRNVARTFLC